MDLDFSGRAVLVVGGTGGIGNAIACAFRGRGAKVIVWGTRPNASDYVDVAACDLDGMSYACVDATNSAEVAAGEAAVERLDVLVLSQGRPLGRKEEFSADGFAAAVELNLNSMMYCAARFHDSLAHSRGALILLSSVIGFHPIRQNPAYSAAKAGVTALTRSLGEAWAEEGIRVNAIAPGVVDTKMNRERLTDPMSRDALLARIPLRRIATPVDVAGVALFLASPLAGYIVGDTISVDGGFRP